MVTIALSTISVIVSVIVFRLHATSTSPVPPLVRLVAFRYMARLLCVPASQTSESDIPGDTSCGQTPTTNCSVELTENVGSRGSKRDLDDSEGSTQGGHCCLLKPQVDNVLGELRKVTISYTYLHGSFRS